MFTYHFSKEPLKLGDYDQKYGQAYWAEVTEHLEPVKFNLMSTEQVDLEDQIECEERTQKRSTKGKDYYQLKKVKVHKAHGQAPAQTAQQEVDSMVTAKYQGRENTQLDRIEKQLTLVLEGLNELKGTGGNDEGFES